MNLNTPRILWGALCASIVIFFVVSQVTSPESAGPAEPVMLIALGATSIVIAAISIAMPNVMYRKSLAIRKLEVTDAPDPNAMPTERGVTPTRRVFGDPKVARRTAMALFLTPFVLGLALGESIACFGLVLGFLGFGMLEVAPFFVVALLLNLARFPRESAIIGPMEQIYRAKLD